MDKDYLNKLRHSTAHLLAAAVTKLWPNAKPTLGPPIENGFYYDFDFGDVKVSEADFPKIEAKMHELVSSWQGFEDRKVDAKAANDFFFQNKYKQELISEFIQKGEEITLYQSGDFTDLCRGGHIKSPKDEIQYFKLLNVAGAYWRGDEKNPMLTRIYGTAFQSQNELDQYLTMLEEAKERDHRKIGQGLELFTFSDLVGKGLPLLTEKGETIWREIERFVVDEELKRGYKHVRTPSLAKTELYKKSGHYPYYKDTMYPAMKIDDEELILRPMTCPHHFALFMDRPRSYRELPLRFAEMADLYRYEKSGELTGLLRVRQFTLADSHNFVRKPQAYTEINMVLDLIEYIANTFGLQKETNYLYRLSLGNRDNKEKYYDAPEEWAEAEAMLKKVLEDRKAPFYEAKDEAAFYGPKIDIQMKNALGKEDTAFTVQYDFCLPARFNLRYINEKGAEEEPIVIHRSSVGAMERTLAFLIEHYAGSFPVWLSPIQVKILPITENNLAYAKDIYEHMSKQNIRVTIDDRSETLQAKIRDAQIEKIPYMVIVGGKEEETQKITVRNRNGKNRQNIDLNDFISEVRSKIDNKALAL